MFEFVYATPRERHKSQQEQAITQNLLSISKPNYDLNQHKIPIGYLLNKDISVPNPLLPQIKEPQTSLQAIQAHKINKLAGDFSRGQVALQRNVKDDDIVMAMRRADAAKDAQQKMPKTAISAAFLPS
jgi:hypothetical protein